MRLFCIFDMQNSPYASPINLFINYYPANWCKSSDFSLYETVLQ